MDSICRFVTVNGQAETMQTINFVYETKNLTKDGSVRESVYKVCIVTGGNAEICLGTVTEKLSLNDVFFIVPAVPYTITSSDDFSFVYISFMGIRAGKIMERLKITRRNFVFRDFPELAEMWQKGLSYKNEVTDLVSEGLLMQTFASIGNRMAEVESKTDYSKGENISIAVKKYIDTNFADPELSLGKITEEFCYNKNYISDAFKKIFGIGIRKYLNIVRINNACVLMERISDLEEIASLCGYSDRLYFSKVFKEQIGISPGRYIKEMYRGR